MNKLFACTLVAAVLVGSLMAEQFGDDSAVHFASDDGGILVEPRSGIREKRAVSCRSVSSQPNNPGTYFEACRAHCILNGKKGGSCVGGSCSCY